jgi:hypothetical protein
VIDWSEALLAAKMELRDAEGELTSTPPGMAVAHLKQAIVYLNDVVAFVERK